jgi:hypothetical protein
MFFLTHFFDEAAGGILGGFYVTPFHGKTQNFGKKFDNFLCSFFAAAAAAKLMRICRPLIIFVWYTNVCKASNIVEKSQFLVTLLLAQKSQMSNDELLTHCTAE